MAPKRQGIDALQPYIERMRALSENGHAPSMARWNAERPPGILAATTLANRYTNWATFVSMCGLKLAEAHQSAKIPACDCPAGAPIAHTVTVTLLSATGDAVQRQMGLCEKCYRIEMEMRETA